MADPRTARPVSGEIMSETTARTVQARPASDRDDMVEADYEVVAPASVRKPSPAGADRKPEIPGGMDMLRGRGEGGGAAMFLSRGGPLFWLAGTALVFAAFWVSGGHSFLSRAIDRPDAGPMLVISDVISRVDVSGPKPVLFVDGQAGNSGTVGATMTEIEIHVTGNDGRVTRYYLGTSGRTMAAGRTFAFSSRLDVPKNGVRSVSVIFSE